MGLVQHLGYAIPPPNAAQRQIRRVSSSRPGAWLFARVMPHVDRVLLRATSGRTALPTVAAGIPVLTLVSRGARSGMLRSTPLLGIPYGDDLALIGTRFGQPGTPDWYFNLRAHPDAEVTYRDERAAVTAREAEGDEWQAIWDRACRVYSGYAAYATRIHDRPIHIMVLEPAGPGAGPTRA